MKKWAMTSSVIYVETRGPFKRIHLRHYAMEAYILVDIYVDNCKHIMGTLLSMCRWRCAL